MIGTSQLINAFSRPCFTDTTDIFKDGSGVALYGLDYDASDAGGTSGKFGEAAIFNGSSSKIVTTLNPNGFSQIAISCWIKTTSTGANDHIVSANDGTNWCFLSMASGIVTFGASNGGSSIFSATHTGAINDGNWHHVVGNYNGTNATLYIDSTGYTPVSATASLSVNTAFGIGYRNTASPSGTYYDGSIDQVRIFNTALTSSQVTQLHQENSSTVGTHLFGCIANYNLDGNAKESMGTTAYDGTETDIKYRYDGTPTNVDFGVGGKSNYGARFNGNNSYINTGATLLGQTYTVSLWFNANTITSSSDGDTLYAQYNSADVGRHIVSIYNGNLRIFVGGQTVQTISTTWSTSTWTHLAVIKNSSGYEAFVNGSSIGTSSLTANIDVTENTMIGGDDGLATYSFDGDIDQVRIFSKALSSAEVGKLYGDGAGEIACEYTSTTDIVNYPTGTTPVAYYKLDNSSEDFSTGGNDGTETNIEYRFGRFGQAAVFNGSNSIITATQPSGLNGPCTYSVWLKTTSSSYQSIITVGSVTGSHTGGVNLFVNSGKLSCQTGNGSNVENSNVNSTSNINTGNWVHCAVVVAGSTQGSSIKVYVDAQEEGSGTANNTAIVAASSESLCLGGRILSGSQSTFLNGSLDQVRIFTSALTASQITELYNEKPEVDTSNFKAVLYEGTGATQYISNVGMDLETSGGLVWLKSRTNSNGHRLYDSVRGATKALSSEDTYAEYTESGLTSFEENGFFVGSHTGVNQDSQDFVAWNWKGGGDAVNIGVNSITGSTPSRASSVSANTAAGFSIVSLDKPNTNTDTYGHGLSSIVEMIILKRTASPDDDWYVYHKDLGNSVRISLNSDAAKVTGTGVWASTTPTANLFTLQNQTGGAHIAYCFHSVAGYSKIGSYSGGSSGSSNVIVTGFKPSFLMVKRTDQAGDAWQLFDIVRGGSDTFDNYLQANNSNIEASYSAREVNFTTNGFYWTNAESGTNISGGTYIYMAFK